MGAEVEEIGEVVGFACFAGQTNNPAISRVITDLLILYQRSVEGFTRQHKPGFKHRIRVQRDRVNALFHQPFGQIRVV